MRVNGDIDLVNPRAERLLTELMLPKDPSAGWLLLAALNADLPYRFQNQDCDTTPGWLLEQLPLERVDILGQKRYLGLTAQFNGTDTWLFTLEDVTRWRQAELAQLELDKRYRYLLENVPAGVVIHGPQSEILTANLEASRILGLSLAQLKGRDAIDPVWHFVTAQGDILPHESYPVAQVMASHKPLKHFIVGSQGGNQQSIMWAICNDYPIVDMQGEITEVIVSFTDITALKNAQSALQISEERLRLALKGSNDAHWDSDLVGGTAYYSPRWWEMIGYAVDSFPADSHLWARLMHPDDKPSIKTGLMEAMNGSDDSFEFEFRLQHQDGHYVPVVARAFILRNASGQAIRVAGTNTDLTERKQAEQQIHRMAFYDALTELPNRRLLSEQLKKALPALTRSHGNGALLFIDLDHFKQLNDTLGHDVGDQLLQQAAVRLKGCVRGDDIVARLGGDEFVILTDSLSADSFEAAVGAEHLARKVLEVLNAAYTLNGRPYQGTASVGVTLLNATSPSVDAMLKQADMAMYQAKSEGRNQVCFFDAAMQAALEQRVAMQADLRDALALNQLELYYQPQVRLGEGVIGTEGLLRWHHPVLGLVPPNSFIPLAEETGLIIPIGRWVIQQACAQIARWSRDPDLHSLVVAVNVSAHQFHHADFVQHVLDALTQTGINAQQLKLELTESALAKDMDLVIENMAKLRARGVTFSLDDFGTGYSSLAYVNRLPLDQLKIDRSFVHDLLTHSNAATLARVIITMSDELKLPVMAEGVETIAQRDFLHQAGCRDYQGYLYGQPVPVKEFEAMFHRLQADPGLTR